MRIDVEGVTCGYGGSPVLRDVSLVVPAGAFVGIIGPNGSGKSTLLRVMGRVLPPAVGRVLLGGQDLYRLGARTVARVVAAVPQDTHVAFDFTVEELVALGRLPHLGRFQAEGEADRRAVERAMGLAGVLALRHRLVRTLSGGERQRVHLARALAQEPRVLLLDEPTAHLDLMHQMAVLDLAARLNREEGLTVVAVLHDLNLAALYCHTVYLLCGGQVVAQGPPAAVLNEPWLAAAYGWPVRVVPHPVYGSPLVLPRCGAREGS